MSAIAGAVRLDGGLVDRALVARVRAAMPHRGHCAIIDGTSATPSIAFDGRIDNHRELEAALGLGPSCPEPDLALAAYHRWSDGCAVRLLGDFAFAVWDPTFDRLFCARDIVGVKPFFYAIVEGTLVFASELHALFQHPRLQRAPNEGMVAEFLNDTITSREETLFRDVRRLPPAHALRLERGRIVLRKYWTPDVRNTSVRSDDEYASELSTLLATSISCRTDSTRIAAQLSGGLDSSSIVAVATTLPNRPRVHAYSLVFPGRPYDENPYSAAVVRHLRGVRHRTLDVRSWDAEWFTRQAEEYLDCPLGPTAGVLAGMLAAARADGHTSMLTGEGADEWFSGSAQAYADLIARGRLGDLALELLRAPRRRAAVHRLLACGLWPLTPPGLRRPVRALARMTGHNGSVSEWLDRSFARKTAVEDRCRRCEYDRTSGLSRASWDIAQCLVDGTQALAFEIADRLAARVGIEERHSFYDRRVIEFALALPEQQRAARGIRKRVLRRAMQDLLPHAVCARTDKADFTPLYLDWFEAIGAEAAFDRLAIADAGWIRPDAAKRAYLNAFAALRAGFAAPTVPALWTVAALDAWFRAAILREPLVIRSAAAAS